MRILILVLAMSLFGFNTSAQQAEKRGMSEREAYNMAGLPELKSPRGYSFKSLPTKKDNTATDYFPQVFMQDGWSCNQASSVGYLFTYEMNALRDVSASNPSNLYPPTFVWNFLNNGDWETGVSYFDSWEVIRTNGIPSVAEYGEHIDAQRWISGYDMYYQGMKNRTQDVFSLFVGDPEGLKTLKGWINDHLDGSPNGGLANFQIGSGGMKVVKIPDGIEEEGKFIMESFNWKVGHAMTFVGWNDDVMHDFNGDGQYTNDIDITGDGIVDMRDWEIGAMLAVNSWGENWPEIRANGRVYVPYRLLALDSWHGGIWARSVTVMRPKREYEPQLTIKASVSHTKRNQLKIVAGVARNFAADAPEYILEFPIFNFTGGPLAMQGTDGNGTETLEFGLDITPFLNYIDPNAPAKFFLEVYHREGEESNGAGEIDYFSIMDYGSDNVIEEESPEKNLRIRIRDITRMSVIYDPIAEPVRINTASLPDAHVGEGYSSMLQAGGGTPPYKWTNMANEYVAEEKDEDWEFPFAEKILGISDTSRLVIDLNYSFPFYGEEYNQLTVLKNGGVIMGPYPKDYPYVIDPRMYIFQNPGVYPFYTDLKYMFPSDGVYRLDEEDGTIIAWDATLSKNNEVYDPKFGVKLFKDGRIETGYIRTAIKNDWNWIVGVSKGDMLSYTLPDINNDPIFSGGFRMDYNMNNWPSWLFFSENGVLLGIAEDGASRYFLPIKVTDNAGLYNMKTYNLQINGTSSVDFIDSNAGIEIYPNPFVDRINLKLENIVSEKIKFDLFSVDGKMVYSKELSAAANISIDLSKLKARGSYFYQIDVGGEVFRGKVVR